MSHSCLQWSSGLTVLLLATAARLHANDEVARFPAEVAKCLAALPADTETVTVARDFEFRYRDWSDKSAPAKPRALVPGVAKEARAWFDEAVIPQITCVTKPPRAVREALEGCHVAHLVEGGRDYRVSSAFGSYVFESAGMFILQDPLQDAGDTLRKQLARKAEVRMIADRKVYVLPVDRSDREQHVPTEKWEGAFVVLLDDRTIVTATSDRFLDAFLRGLNQSPQKRPPVLQSLADVDPDDAAWMVRVPAANAQTHRLALQPLFARIVWRWRNGESPAFIAHYRPAPKRTVEDVERTVASFFKEAATRPDSAAISLTRAAREVKLGIDVTKFDPEEMPVDANTMMTFALRFLWDHQGLY